MATGPQLIEEILKELGVYQAGQDLPPEDYRVVEERLPFEIASLYAQNIYSLDSLDHIPDEAVVELAKYIAGQMVNLFGIAGAEAQTLLQGMGAAERALRYLRTMPYTGVRQRSEYFLVLSAMVLAEVLCSSFDVGSMGLFGG